MSEVVTDPLAAATDRMRVEREATEARNRVLERLVARRSALVDQLDTAPPRRLGGTVSVLFACSPGSG